MYVFCGLTAHMACLALFSYMFKKNTLAFSACTRKRTCDGCVCGERERERERERELFTLTNIPFRVAGSSVLSNWKESSTVMLTAFRSSDSCISL